MLFPLLLLSVAWPTAASSYPGHDGGRRQPKVTLNDGTQVRGIIEEKYCSVRQFLGIPYAQPPIGKLRWEAPQANRLPRSVDATKYGRSCTQFQFSVPSVYTEDVLEFNVPDVNTSGEDCLSFGVWTPKSAKNLPVLIFLYGGGWYTGGQNIAYQIPTQWIERTKDLIVVVPNFRGNIFGFPNARGAKYQNLGLLDQRLAVEWVRDNIQAFGGDPSKITIWGQSSGAEAVDAYNYAWYKDPIVKGLILDSGSILIEGGAGPRYSNFSYVASQVGCGKATSARAELECMKKVDEAKINNFLADYYNGGSTSGLAFAPSADEKIVFSNYTDRIRQGKLSRVPSIIGVNKNDGAVFAPYNASGPDQSISDLLYLNFFLCPSYKGASLQAATGIPTYRFLYAGNFSNVSPRPWLGAYHQSELPLLFGTFGNYRGRPSKYETAVSEALQDSWRAFANDPQHGLSEQHWSRYTPEHDVVRSFGDRGSVAQDRVGLLRSDESQCQ